MFSLQQSDKVDTIITPTSQMGELGPREVKYVAHGHTASKSEQIWDPNSGFFDSKARYLASTLLLMVPDMPTSVP